MHVPISEMQRGSVECLQWRYQGHLSASQGTAGKAYCIMPRLQQVKSSDAVVLHRASAEASRQVPGIKRPCLLDAFGL